MQFWNFLVVRLLQAVVVIVIVVSLVFLVSRLVGNPEQFLAGPDATEEDLAVIEERFGLNDPLIVQYGNFLADLLRGDFGHSWMGAAPRRSPRSASAPGTRSSWASRRSPSRS